MIASWGGKVDPRYVKCAVYHIETGQGLSKYTTGIPQESILLGYG